MACVRTINDAYAGVLLRRDARPLTAAALRQELGTLLHQGDGLYVRRHCCDPP